MKRCLTTTLAFCLMTSPSTPAYPQAVALEDLARHNLMPNPGFENSGSKGRIRSWTVHPDPSPLIRPLEGGGVDLLPGAAALVLTSRAIAVEGGKAYTLAFGLRQENIHIGFGMGTRVMFLWTRKDGSRTPDPRDMIDGSFDWETRGYSVVAPEGADSLQIRLSKRGSPGRVSMRDIRFAPGTLAKTREEMSLSDFLRAEAAFTFFRSQLRDLMADKGALEIPNAAQTQKALEAKVAEAIATVQADRAARSLSASEDERGKMVWNEMLKGNVGFRMEPSLPYYAQWQALNEEMEAFAQRVAKWVATENTPRLQAAMEAAFGEKAGYAIGVGSTMLKTRRDAPYLGPVAAEASVELAREEEEGVQITLAALETPLEEVQLSVGELRNAAGEALPASALSIHRIDFVQTNPPQYYAAGPVGWWPDVVFPATGVERIAPGENQAFWVTVAADGQTPAGVYKGEVAIAAKGQPVRKVGLSVRVWDFALPRPGKFEVVGCFHPYMLKNFYRWDKIREEVVAKWAAFIVRKRWNPTLYFSKALTPNGEPLKAALGEGLNAINLLDPSKFLDRDESRTFTWPTPEQEKELREAATAARAEFVAAGGDPAKTKLYVSGFDEQHDREQYRLMKHVFTLAKEAAPGARAYTTTTYPPLGELAGVVDTWVPLLGSDSEDLRARQAAGDEVHFYVYAHPFRPYPNPNIIDYHGADARVTFWAASRKGYSGFLHYLFNGWKANNDQPGPRWPQQPWLPFSGENQKNRNGSGYFIYPGPDGVPVASVRMELVREGIEDWETIELLREVVAKAKAQTPPPVALAQAEAALEEAAAIAPALDEFTLDMGRILSARRSVAEAILALKGGAQ